VGHRNLALDGVVHMAGLGARVMLNLMRLADWGHAARRLSWLKIEPV